MERTRKSLENRLSKVRSGQVRVLIGSTSKMGAGTNCLDKLIALHDLDCPWRPSDLAQRLGRIVRQGNQNPEVEIFRYVTENTFDAYLYQLVENKQKFILQYHHLLLKLDDMERMELYFRGHMDAVAYLKRIQAI